MCAKFAHATPRPGAGGVEGLIEAAPRKLEAREGRNPNAGKEPLRFPGWVSFWAPLCLLGAYLYWELMERFSELAPRLGAASRDIAIYRRAGEAILAGQVPYRDFFTEYPPGSLPFFAPPAVFSPTRGAYASLFASEMDLVLVATLLLTACAARSLGRPWPLLPAGVFVAGARPPLPPPR